MLKTLAKPDKTNSFDIFAITQIKHAMQIVTIASIKQPHPIIKPMASGDRPDLE